MCNNRGGLNSWSRTDPDLPDLDFFSNQEILILQHLQILISSSRPDPDLITKLADKIREMIM